MQGYRSPYAPRRAAPRQRSFSRGRPRTRTQTISQPGKNPLAGDKVTTRQIQNKMLKLHDVVNDLTHLSESIDYNMISAGARAKAEIFAKREHARSFGTQFPQTLGFIKSAVKPLSRDERQWLENYRTLHSKLTQIGGKYVHAMSGSQYGEKELRWHLSGVINKKLSPTEARASLNQMVSEAMIHKQVYKEMMLKGEDMRSLAKGKGGADPSFKNRFMEYRYKFEQKYHPYRDAFMKQNPDATSGEALRTYMIIQNRKNNDPNSAHNLKMHDVLKRYQLPAQEQLQRQGLGMTDREMGQPPGALGPPGSQPGLPMEGPQRPPIGVEEQFGNRAPGAMFQDTQQQRAQEQAPMNQMFR